tara:strand:- start:331 stop:714 length:384 start_codon:yes stop_codon:yes gene_type:complete
MESSRGPKDQYTPIQRRYYLRLLVGVLTVMAGLFATSAGVTLSNSDLVVPGAEQGQIQIMSNPMESTATIGVFALIIALVINLYSINKFSGEYEEVGENASRPKNQFILLGILVTIVTEVLGYLVLF